MDDARIDPGATIGAVHLTVADRERSTAFYRDALGFSVQLSEDSEAHLGTEAAELVGLAEIPGARRPARATGLYHLAILVPSRGDLARSLARIHRSSARLVGASDHGVSEALYLADPDGNGIEIYSDRPRDEWPRYASGKTRLTIEPLDLDELLSEAGPSPAGPTDQSLPPDTRVGHVHLHVADLAAAERFYVDALGFDVMERYGVEAVFVSAGGYHHHIGFNTWAGVGAPPPPPGSAGLRWFEIRHSSAEEQERTTARVRRAGIDAARDGADYQVQDPSGNAIRLTVGTGAVTRAGGRATGAA